MPSRRALADHVRASRWFDALRRTVQQQPLVQTGISLDAVDRAAGPVPPDAVFVGIGLCNRTTLGRALPFDTLGVLLPAELVRRAVEARNLVVLVADSHALRNGLDPDQVKERTTATLSLLSRVRRRLGLEHMVLVSGSEVHKTVEYQRVLDTVDRCAPSQAHDYFKREVADIAVLRHRYRGIVKVGWTISASGGLRRQHDELAFDRNFRKWLGSEVLAIYCKPGRSLDDRYLRVPPYITTRPHRRVCLTADEDVRGKLALSNALAEEQTIRAVRNHLKAILRTYGDVVEPLNGTVEQRVEAVLRRLFA